MFGMKMELVDCISMSGFAKKNPDRHYCGSPDVSLVDVIVSSERVLQQALPERQELREERERRLRWC